MRKIFFGVLILIAIILIALVTIPFLVPSSVYKSAIEDQLSKELDRDVQIRGDISVSPFPVLKAKTERVTIGNAEGFRAEHFASMNGMEARIKLMPLLSKKVEIASFTLVDPEINLEKLSDGRANWEFGKTEATKPQDKGPFKRDGRYGNIDPSIGNFTLKNGTISFVDAQAGKSYDLKNVNMDFSLPSLASPVDIDGDLIFNNMPMDIDLTLDTPRSFLNGQKTPVSITAKTDFGDLKAKGYFTEGQDITFKFDIDSSVRDLLPLSDYIPKDFPITDILKSVDLSGSYGFDGKTFDATNTDIALKGPSLDTRYKGNASFSQKPILDGNLEITASNLSQLTKALDLQINGLDLAQTLNLTADLKAEGNGFASDNVSAKITGDGFNMAFDGQASFLGTPKAVGNFSGDIASIPSVVSALKMDVPQAKALGNAKLRGRLSLDGTDVTLDLEESRTEGANLNASYTGKIVKFGDDISMDGAFDSKIPSLSSFASATGTEIPYSNSISKVDVAGNISGKSDDLTLSDLNVTLSDGQVNGKFTGGATFNDGFVLNGHLDADIPSARTLAEASGAQLPASTSAGEIYEHVALKGNVTGTPAEIKFADANLKMDSISGQGDFTLDMTGTKPALIGKLDLGQLDLRPYMAAYSAQKGGGGIQPWNTVPYNFEALKMLDGTFNVKTPEVLFGPLKMGQTDVAAQVSNGVLTAKLPQINLYGGLGVLTATLDASGAIPKVKMDVRLEDITTNRFLSSIANYTQLEGQGHTLLELTGEGRTQAEIMKSLNGYGDFKVLDGVVSGVDLSQFLGGLESVFASRSLPKGIGKDYATKFQDIVGIFKVKDGVVSIDEFNLKALDAVASGSGKFDIGNQAVDFSLRPRLTGSSAGDVASFGIPLKIKGNWGAISTGLDSDLLGNIVAEKAKLRAKKELTDRIGGDLGDALGGILGQTGNTSQTPSAPTNPDATTGEEPAPPSTTEDKVENLLGGLLGGKETTEAQTPDEVPANDNTPPAEAEDKKTTEEEVVEDVLKSLFKKKKKTGE